MQYEEKQLIIFLLKNSNIGKENKSIWKYWNTPGKVIYEVLRIIQENLLFLENHLLRMENSF